MSAFIKIEKDMYESYYKKALQDVLELEDTYKKFFRDFNRYVLTVGRLNFLDIEENSLDDYLVDVRVNATNYLMDFYTPIHFDRIVVKERESGDEHLLLFNFHTIYVKKKTNFIWRLIFEEEIERKIYSVEMNIPDKIINARKCLEGIESMINIHGECYLSSEDIKNIQSVLAEIEKDNE